MYARKVVAAFVDEDTRQFVNVLDDGSWWALQRVGSGWAWVPTASPMTPTQLQEEPG